jgi:LytS/YehU family sensor histidine kinase
MQAVLPPQRQGLARIFAPRRLVFTTAAATLMGLIVSPVWVISTLEVVARAILIGLAGLAVFGMLETWPARLPAWLARWALQVLGVVMAIPLTVLLLYVVITVGDQIPWWKQEARLSGFIVLTFAGIALASWMTLAALIRQREEQSRSQALAFELEKSELERRALDSRLRLLQAQVAPHFLFNTLANVRELVDSGSPQASKVLDTLISYLRAAVPRLHDRSTSVAQEIQLVRAYLDLMQMRMPDRLRYSIEADDAALPLACPPTTLLTLVENAIRHGIDPSEEGGRIDVRVAVRDGRCVGEVSDSGVGLTRAGDAGTGLASLRERLQLAFDGRAELRLTTLQPHGVRAVVEFPARRSDA